MNKTVCFLLFVCLSACEAPQVKHKPATIVRPLSSATTHKPKKTIPWHPLETNLVNIQLLHAAIRVELKYASTDNFMKKRLYKRLNAAFLQKDIAERLAKCQASLSLIDTNLHLLVYDAVRPVSVQKEMWKALDTVPFAERVKFVSNPLNKSLHNYGAAVDLTICTSQGIPLDMGAGYDDIRAIAHPRMEDYFLASGELTTTQVDNRRLLRKVMRSQGFTNLSTEWWHFNGCSRNTARKKYRVLERE
jgi:D-alanyl-D-alanine dipeptidase